MPKIKGATKPKHRSKPRRMLTDEDKAANRRKLLAKLEPDTRAFTAREFAKLGLFQ